MARVLIIQPGYAHYRDQLFSILSKRHDICVLYEGSKNTYPGKKNNIDIKIEYLGGGVKNKWLSLVSFLFKYKPEVVISSIPTTIRTQIAFVYAVLFRKRFILWMLEWRRPKHDGFRLKNILATIRYQLASKIIINADALIVAGTASHRFACSFGRDEDSIFMALQSSNDQCAGNHAKWLEQSKSETNCTRAKYTFLYLGRIIPWKGLNILVKAFRLLGEHRNDVRLLVAGDGPFRTVCERLCQQLSIKNVEFIGSIPNESAYKIYKKSDIFVLPSYFCDNDYEAWGLVVNEAMSIGLPIITTVAVGAAYDLVVDGYNGFVVQDNKVAYLYSAMEKILGMDIREMGSNSRKLFDIKNDFYKMADGFTSAIQYVSKLA